MLFGTLQNPLQDLIRTFASCITPEMSEKPNYALASVLDAADAPARIANGSVHENGQLSDMDLQQAIDGMQQIASRRPAWFILFSRKFRVRLYYLQPSIGLCSIAG